MLSMIRKNIEYERRCMLTKEEHQMILDCLKNLKCKNIDITNTYYDTDNLKLTHQGILLRLRNSNEEKFELTLKISKPLGDIEHNIKLNKEEYDKYEKEHTLLIPKELLKYTRYLKVSDNILIKKCVLKTKRKEIKISDYLIVIDENYYNGITDYNIEIEANSMKQAKKIMKDYTHTFRLKNKRPSKTKSERALSTIKK